MPEPTDKDILVYTDKSTNLVSYLDLRTGKPLVKYESVKTGRFSSEVADFICDSIRSGKTLVATCDTLNIPPALFYGWLAIFPEFKKRYTEARKQRSDYHFFRALDLAESALGADKEDIPGIKLALDTHKWAAEKSDPERFAKPTDSSNNGMGSITINLTTGVLDKAAPKDIVVDQFGNFQGFENDISSEPRDSERPPEEALTSERFRVYGEEGTEEGRGSETQEEVKE